MNGNATGSFDRIGNEMMKALRSVTKRGYDAEIRVKKDGTFDLIELKRRKISPGTNEDETEYNAVI